jgi:hypothetical protein
MVLNTDFHKPVRINTIAFL